MPIKLKNVGQVFIKTTDGTMVSFDSIKEIELEQEKDYADYLFENSSIIQTDIFRCKITTKNDRNHKSKRYKKNRKGYRGLYDLLM